MGRGSYQSGRAWCGGRLCCALAVMLAGSGSAFAQLTAEDLAALREQGKAKGWTFEVDKNWATDFPLESLCGLKEPPDWREGAKFDPCRGGRGLPERFNWCDYGACPAIRNQGACGSCWAFATVGPLECNILIKDAAEVDLSEQWLVSCNSDGWGCGGGWWAHDYHEWKTDPCGGTGAVYECWFPYTASNAPCDCPYPHSYYIDGWAYIGDGSGVPSVDAIKQAVYDYGPACVGVRVNSAFQAYDRGVFNGCEGGDINHGVTLVGWDDNQGPNGVWIIRNSWGPSWGEGGYMRIEYGCSSIGYAANYVDYGNNRPTVAFEYPDGRPEFLEPGVETTFRVNVLPESGTPVPGTGWLHYSRNDGASYFVVGMNELSPNEYEAVLPPEECYTDFDWYVGVEEQAGWRINDPPRAPISYHSSTVVTHESVLLEDDFETEQGWSIYPGASTGNWERADPEEVTLGDGTVTQPGDDHSPNGTLCYVTGAAAGSQAGDNDVDGGPTRLTAPVLELAGRDAIVSYWRWFHISTSWDDNLRARISNDNGESWMTVERIQSREEWTYVEWKVSDYVMPTDEVLVRFVINDTDPASLMEALIDDFRVDLLTCVPAGVCLEDLTRDGLVNLADLSQLLASYGTTSGAQHRDGDIDGDGDVDLSDLSALLAAYGTTCEW